MNKNEIIAEGKLMREEELANNINEYRKEIQNILLNMIKGNRDKTNIIAYRWHSNFTDIEAINIVFNELEEDGWFVKRNLEKVCGGMEVAWTETAYQIFKNKPEPDLVKIKKSFWNLLGF